MDSDDSSNEDADINEADRNIEGEFHRGLVSGWDDDNDGVEVEEKPTGYCSFHSRNFQLLNLIYIFHYKIYVIHFISYRNSGERNTMGS